MSESQVPVEPPAQPERRMSYTEKYGAGYGQPVPEPGGLGPVVGGAPLSAYDTPRGQYIGAPHPQATSVLVLGIVGVTLCFVAAPFAWAKGGRVVRDIDYSHGRLGGRSAANAGRILGMIGTILIAVYFLFIALVVAGAIGSARRNGY